MADLEGLCRVLMKKGVSRENIIQKIIDEYQIYKELPDALLEELAEAVFEECKRSTVSTKDEFVSDLLKVPDSNITMGEQGVGCRGIGDFFVHKLIADVSSTTEKAYLGPKSLDDAGAVYLPKKLHSASSDQILIVSKMEGMHSRLSDFPFIAGFHVTRAALRDLYVKGAEPISISIDIHLADDADVGKLFDFVAGVSAVSELMNIPITAGSTLRIGGDMVIGSRITGGIGAIGVCTKILPRRNIQTGDKIIITEGAGGGTIATTAIYSGNFDVVKETMNISFLKAAKALLNSPTILSKIHAMCDVTNGGLRGDLHEIVYEAKKGVKFSEKQVKGIVNPQVLKLLESKGVDYLGVSLDSLLIFAEPGVSKSIIDMLYKLDVKAVEIGEIDDSGQVQMIDENDKAKIIPRFRESAYTKIKQVIGEKDPKEQSKMEDKLKKSAKDAIQKRNQVIKYIERHLWDKDSEA